MVFVKHMTSTRWLVAQEVEAVYCLEYNYQPREEGGEIWRWNSTTLIGSDRRKSETKYVHYNVMWPQVVDYIRKTISLPIYCLEYNYQPQEEGEGGKGGGDGLTLKQYDSQPACNINTQKTRQ